VHGLCCGAFSFPPEHFYAVGYHVLSGSYLPVKAGFRQATRYRVRPLCSPASWSLRINFSSISVGSCLIGPPNSDTQ